MDILKSIDHIDVLYCKAEYEKAIELFHKLCKENDFSFYIEGAASILTRYKNYKKQCISGLLIGKKREERQNEIITDFRSLFAGFYNEKKQDDECRQNNSVQFKLDQHIKYFRGSYKIDIQDMVRHFSELGFKCFTCKYFIVFVKKI